MGALGLDVDGVQRLAGGHKQTVSLRPAEAKIGANLWEQNLAYALPVWSEYLDPVVAGANPAGADPYIAVHVRANAIGKPGELSAFHLEFHRAELSAVLQFLPFHHVEDHDVLGRLRIMGRSGITDVQLFVIG